MRQSEAEVDGVIAGVDGQDWRAGGWIPLLQPGADLLSGYASDILPSDDAPDAQGRGPTRAAARHLHQPGVVPTGHHGLPLGLPGGVMVGVMVVASIWAGFRITARPDTRVDGKPRGRWFQGVRSYQQLKLRHVPGPRVEGVVATAPPTLELGARLRCAGVSIVGALSTASSASNRASRRHPNNVYTC